MEWINAMDVKLRKAKKNDIPVLKNLWQICFNDRMRYIDVFFKYMFKEENTLIAEVDKKVAGVVYVLERSLHGKKFLYGYAIGVFPEFRGNNICEKMLDKIKSEIKDTDVIFGLHPANDKLATFYKRIGLNEMYSLKLVDGTNFTSIGDYTFCDVTDDEFFQMRKDAFENSVDWDKNALSYILKNGETVKKTNVSGSEQYFVLVKYNNTLFVKETTANSDEIKKVSYSLKKLFQAEKIKFLLPSDIDLQGEVVPVIYGFSEKNDNVYMNLFLDWGNIWKKKEFVILMLNKCKY